ncbi:hypothetical protein Fmac_000037 [Flemingia macrophylla]|uniref:Elongation factor-like 1 n=1 Tax=Flemingia macrophylla TaxID=520843 RepID=A0ABD1NED1_9FABA
MEEGSSDSETERIRDICILADHLIAAAGGGVVHPKLAVRVRFMDYLDEEQRRAITMKSSSILLRYRRHAVNLIDSPATSTSAARSPPPPASVTAPSSLSTPWRASTSRPTPSSASAGSSASPLAPCLVLNKLDRLITELKPTPSEAYTRLSRIVHEVNGIVSAYKSEKYLSDVDSLLAGASSSGEVLEDYDDNEDVFQPQKGNVIFACALDGWGFGIREFAEIYASKLGASVNALQRALCGAKYYDPKTKDDCWFIRERWMGTRVWLRRLLGGYESLASAFGCGLRMVVRCLPDPVAAQAYRISRLIPKREVEVVEDERRVVEEAETARKAVEGCDCSEEAPCVAFVSKMFAVPVKMLPGQRGEVGNGYGDEGEADSDECFLAFARIFSGVLHSGRRVFVLSPLYDPLKGESMQKHIQEAVLKSLYLMMGQGLKVVTSAKAGNIVAIGGLGQHILKSATLSSTRNCWPFSSIAFQIALTIRVAIEPSDPADVGALLKGLRLLNRADPFVEVTVSARGEHVLAVAGEVHLERCVKDLKERFAKVSLEVSPPLVSYKECIEVDVSNVLENLKVLSRRSDYVEKSIPNGRCVVRVQVMKLLPSLTKVLDESSDLLGDVIGVKPGQTKSLETQRPKKCKWKWQEILRRIWALGPRHIGPNILFTPDIKAESTDSSVLIRGCPRVSERLGFVADSSVNDLVAETPSNANQTSYMDAEHLERQHDESETQQQSEQYGIFAGQVIATVKDACRAAVLQNKPRLVEAMYFCELNTPTEYLGSMYAVLSRRRARILKEEMQEGSPFFTVHAYVPVSESFGFADQLRRWTSGAASALLVLSHWDALPEDPFFIPKTEEEIEEFGDGSRVLPNTARKLIDAVRRHKGLPVEEKVVQHGTKQRTLARKV